MPEKQAAVDKEIAKYPVSDSGHCLLDDSTPPGTYNLFTVVMCEAFGSIINFYKFHFVCFPPHHSRKPWGTCIT